MPPASTSDKQTKNDSQKKSRKTRRRKERSATEASQSADATPIASGSSTPKGKEKAAETVDTPIEPLPQSHSGSQHVGVTVEQHDFEDGEDFIPLFDDTNDMEKGLLNTDPSGKGKGRAWGGEVEGSSSSSRKEREWDRGKPRDVVNNERYGHKRKYDAYDSDDGYTNKKQSTNASSRVAPWIRDLDWDGCRNVAEMLHKEVKAFTDWISPTPVEDEIRTLTVELISRTIQKTFPDAKIIPFGSFETKLYLPLGDIDLVILSDSMAFSDKVTVLHAIARILKRSGITSHVTIIAKAKVPIVKFVTTHGRFNVDISINQDNGLLSGKIVNGFLKDMHGMGEEGKGSLALRSLVFVVKTFLSQRSMNEVYSGGLGSYSIVCLAVSFLQMHPKIRFGEIDADKNLGVLVMEFFELYGSYFNFSDVGISLRDGGTYFSKEERGWDDYNRHFLLSIEDPADPSNDISKGSYGIQKVRTAFAGAHGILTANAYLRAGIINSRRDGSSVHLRPRYHPEDLSILSSVMGITQETINHRKLVQELYDKRLLHDMLGTKSKIVTKHRNNNQSRNNNHPVSSGSRGANAVHSAWRESDLAEDSKEEDSRNKRSDIHIDEGGRYDIRKQEPSRKRRKTERREPDRHTVYILDDEDDSDDHVEEGEYLSDSERRSYWLSKGMSGIDSD